MKEIRVEKGGIQHKTIISTINSSSSTTSSKSSTKQQENDTFSFSEDNQQLVQEDNQLEEQQEEKKTTKNKKKNKKEENKKKKEEEEIEEDSMKIKIGSLEKSVNIRIIITLYSSIHSSNSHSNETKIIIPSYMDPHSIPMEGNSSSTPSLLSIHSLNSLSFNE